LSGIVSFTSTIFAGFGCLAVWQHPVFGLDHLLDERLCLTRDHDLGAFRHMGAGAAAMIDVMMGKHQLLDRLEPGNLALAAPMTQRDAMGAYQTSRIAVHRCGARLLAQQHSPGQLMLIEPKISRSKRDAGGTDLRGAVFNSANTDRGCAHKRHCDSNHDCNQMLDGHDSPPFTRHSERVTIALM
jgi:hypothetical protein